MSTSQYNFLPHSDADREAMLVAIGVKTAADLFADIDPKLRESIEYKVLHKNGLTEQALQADLKALSNQNKAATMASFLGGGAYHRFIPMAVNTIASRSEFYTAYTPYQPEMAQGTLQVGYEFQTMIAALTGMDVANASVYDGGVAVAEAAFMAVRITKKKKLLIPSRLNPDYKTILETYVTGLGTVSIDTYDAETGFSQWQSDADIAAVIVQNPDYLGTLTDLAPVRQFCDVAKAILIVSADPVSLGLLEAPGNQGADIVVGDIQPLGNNLSFGGPYGGFMATKTQYMRQLPGRLVGKTVDKDGRPCYSLTLQTREQHIRREKATSNICTNQALNILKATVYLSLVGPQGLKDLAAVSVQRAHWLAAQLTAIDGVSLVFSDKPFAFEFAINLPTSAEPVLAQLAERGILGGIPLKTAFPQYPNGLLVAVTEMNTPESLTQYVTALKEILSGTSNGRATTTTTSPTTSSPATLEVCHS